MGVIGIDWPIRKKGFISPFFILGYNFIVSKALKLSCRLFYLFVS